MAKKGSHSGVDYSKWDNLANHISDDEEEASHSSGPPPGFCPPDSMFPFPMGSSSCHRGPNPMGGDSCGHCPDCASEMLVQCAAEGNLQRLAHALHHTNASQESQQEALYAAVQGGHLEIVKYLLEQGEVEPDGDSEEMMTPLMCAVRDNRGAIMELLLEEGACPNATEPKTNHTAMFYAVYHDRKHLVNRLLQEGAEVNSPVDRHHTALQLAARMGHIGPLNVLLKAGADRDMVGPAKDTALAYAAWKNQHAAVTALLCAGANPDQTTGKGMSPLMLAAKYGRVEIFTELLSSGASLFLQNKQGHNAADIARMSSNVNKDQILNIIKTAVPGFKVKSPEDAVSKPEPVPAKAGQSSFSFSFPSRTKVNKTELKAAMADAAAQELIQEEEERKLREARAKMTAKERKKADKKAAKRQRQKAKKAATVGTAGKDKDDDDDDDDDDYEDEEEETPILLPINASSSAKAPAASSAKPANNTKDSVSVTYSSIIAPTSQPKSSPAKDIRERVRAMAQIMDDPPALLDECPVCLMDLIDCASTEQLECGHVFCSDCIARWFDQCSTVDSPTGVSPAVIFPDPDKKKKGIQHTCPVCRRATEKNNGSAGLNSTTLDRAPAGVPPAGVWANPPRASAGLVRQSLDYSPPELHNSHNFPTIQSSALQGSGSTPNTQRAPQAPIPQRDSEDLEDDDAFAAALLGGRRQVPAAEKNKPKLAKTRPVKSSAPGAGSSGVSSSAVPAAAYNPALAPSITPVTRPTGAATLTYSSTAAAAAHRPPPPATAPSSSHFSNQVPVGSKGVPAPPAGGPSFQPALYKTKECRRWATVGYCERGSSCWFAHGPSELRPFLGFGESAPAEEQELPAPKPTLTLGDHFGIGFGSSNDENETLQAVDDYNSPNNDIFGQGYQNEVSIPDGNNQEEFPSLGLASSNAQNSLRRGNQHVPKPQPYMQVQLPHQPPLPTQPRPGHSSFNQSAFPGHQVPSNLPAQPAQQMNQEDAQLAELFPYLFTGS